MDGGLLDRRLKPKQRSGIQRFDLFEKTDRTVLIRSRSGAIGNDPRHFPRPGDETEST